MGDTNLEPASTANDLIRTFLTFLDRPAYWLLGIVYELFFNVASADLFSNDTIMKFYGRVQVILGVFMMFELALTILKGIVNPDNFAKEGSNVIVRVATSLILITLLMPISIPGARNEYEKQVNNNGLLFGTLYSLQHRILANNTLGRLVLGTTDSTPTFVATNDGNDSELKKSARIFTSTIIKGFYRINLVPEDERNKEYLTSGKDPATYNENRVCKDIDDEVLAAYTRIDADPGEIISLVNATCDSDLQPGFLNSAWTGIQKLTGTTKYVFTYNPVISLIVPIVFIFILLSFTIDVAVRAVKLAVLRLIAPIPLISYMDPKGSKDSSFNAWTKALTSTYLDLFIRLAVVYFVIFLIQDMIVNGISIDLDARGGVLGVLSLIIIWVGLFIFAKQAPKFIKQVLGMKEDAGGKLFGGFGEILAAGSVGVGAVGGAISNGVGTYASGGNVGKSILAGITGGVYGAHTAGKTYFDQKQPDAGAIMNKVRANNARNYSQTADDSTFFGRFRAGLQSNIGIQNDAQKMDTKIARYQRAEAAWKSVQNALNSDDWTGANAAAHTARGGYIGATNFVSSRGENLVTAGSIYSVKSLRDTLDRMKSSGQYSQSEINTMDGIVKDAEKSRFDYIRRQSATTLDTPVERQIFEGATQIYQTASKHSGDSDGVWATWAGVSGIDDASLSMGRDFKGAGFAAGRQATAIKSSAEYSTAQANAKRASESQSKK